MDKLRKISSAITVCFFCNIVTAQGYVSDENPSDFMRNNGKIYVVVGVVVIIVTGIFIYLLSLERRIKKLERESKDK